MSAVDDYLKAIENAAIETCAAWSDDCVLDATLPNRRLRKSGVAAVKNQFAEWYAYRSTVFGVRRWQVPEGEIIEYTHRLEGPDGPREAHHVHVLELVDGRIVRDTMFCGGLLSDAQLAEMAVADA